MSIRIIRNTGWVGYGSKIHIKVNGEKVASVINNQQINIELPHGKDYLKVTQGVIKSKEIEAEDGDVLQIIQTRWHQISFPLFMFIAVLRVVLINYIPNLMDNFKYISMIFIFLGISLIISMILINVFQLKVMTDVINE